MTLFTTVEAGDSILIKTILGVVVAFQVGSPRPFHELFCSSNSTSKSPFDIHHLKLFFIHLLMIFIG
ncbi:hypothetical protein HanXRQr2_Chr12g0554931 [Helianthus annuus]|uniref:Uncharacterized protein n=1 Tax=Helianthus annuus TaxID=4232 RepID=A0A9K3MXM4_HELAN|nr:hypothetical protein HanXRQr2_Chr12g0554931 [Helianthus annuus]